MRTSARIQHGRLLWGAALLLACWFGVASCRSAPLRETPAPSAAGKAPADLPSPPREFRAAWIATVANIDWPSRPGLPVDSQKAELVRMLDRAAALRLNAVLFQVRPAADALYDSPYEPWSYHLTGRQGQAPRPYYDPLAFAVREAHARGLELHAWFNPYRAHHPTDRSPKASSHVSRTQPSWVRTYGAYQWLDPGMPAVRAHTLQVILDVVRRYDIDGVHFDDYFYPYRSYADGAAFPDDLSWRAARAAGEARSRDDWRRHNVDRLVEAVHREVRALKPHVKFGISPFGIWRPGHPEGTTGFDAYAELYADARRWVRAGWLDYVTPQLYYRIDQDGQPYPVMLRWWTQQNVHGRHVWPGNYTSRIRTATARRWPVDEILGQVYITRALPEATGNVHFSMKALMAAGAGAADTSGTLLGRRLAQGPYAETALVPASPWLDDVPPGRPAVRWTEAGGRVVLHLIPPADEPVRQWVVRRKVGGQWRMDVVPAGQRRYVLPEGEAPAAVAVSVVDRVGNEGAVTVVQSPVRRAAS